MKLVLQAVGLSAAGVVGAAAALGVWYILMVQIVAPFAAWLNAA